MPSTPQTNHDHGESMPSPLSVLAASDEWAVELMQQVREDSISDISDRIRRGEMIDHELYAREFAAAYHIVNSRKALRAIREARIDRLRSAADFGCGSGASAVALIAHWVATRRGRSEGLHLTLIDKSSAELRLARQCIDRLPVGVQDGLTVNYVCSDLRQRQTTMNDSFDVVVVAHVLTENRHHSRPIVESAGLAAAPGGSIVFLEQTDDPVWADVRYLLAEQVRDALMGQFEIQQPEAGNGPLKRWAARWCAIAIPPNDRIHRLVNNYFKAWQHGDVHQLSEVFTSDATYHEKPFIEPLRGLTAIQQYWRDEVVPQLHRQVTIRRVAWLRDGALVEWKATFDRDDEKYHLRGAMILESSADQSGIVMLREYFKTERRLSSDYRDP